MRQGSTNRLAAFFALAAVSAGVAAACLLGLAAPAAAEVHTAATEHRKGEIIKTARIGKQKWSKSAVAMSLNPQSVSSLGPGDFVEAAGELQVSVCLKPNPRHHGSPQPCPGSYYSFEPRIAGRLVLSGSERGTKGTPIGGDRTIDCTHKQPNRNHHCVLSVPWRGKALSERTAACQPRCYVNFVVTAWHKQANPAKHKVSIGATNSNGRVKQGKAKLSSVVHESGRNAPLATWGTKRRARSSIKVSAEGKDRRGAVVMSQRVDGLRAGDQLRVHARPVIGIGGLPYNALMRTEVHLSDSPGGVDPGDSRRAAKAADSTTRISASNGFNCTLGNSGFRTPCGLDKTGILSVRKGSAKPLYVNVVVSLGAKGPDPLTRKWRPSHRAQVAKGGFIQVQKFRGSSACGSCQVSGGGQRFSNASSARDVALVASIRKWGVQEGTYSCFSRGGEHVCSWSSTGRYDGSPAYECSQKSFGRKTKSGNWVFDTGPCKDALAKSLWAQLLDRHLKPDFTGVCEQVSSGARCKWFAHTLLDKFCKGEATWLTAERRWRVDPCRI